MASGASQAQGDPELASRRPFAWLDDNVKWLMVTLIIPLTTFVYGFWQNEIESTRAEAEKTIADARENVAAMTSLLPALSDDDLAKSSLALIALKQLEEAQHDREAMRACDSAGETAAAEQETARQSRICEMAAAVQARIDDRRGQTGQTAEQRAGLARAQERIASVTGAASTPVTIESAAAPLVAPSLPAVATAPAERPRLVYLQVFNDVQRGQAGEIQRQLRAEGIGAPGIEDVSVKLKNRGPRTAQIRYFNPEDLGGAKWLQKFLNDRGGNWSIVKASASGVPNGQLECWWPVSNPIS